MSWLTRLARRLVPRAWRDAVDEELSDESARTGAASLIGAARIAGIGVRLRWSIAIDALACDLRLAARSLVKAKRLTIPAIAAFALGIGANIAVFSTLDRLMFRPLPYAEPGRLVQIHTLTLVSATPRALIDSMFAGRIADESSMLSGLAYAVAAQAPTTIPELDPAPLQLGRVTANLLDTLGVRPILGRGFTPDRDHTRGGPHEVLLDYGTWRARFGGSTAIFDRSYGQPPWQYRIVGVLPQDFVLPSSLLLAKDDGIVAVENEITGHFGRPGMAVPSLVARLHDGASVSQASRELEVLWQREPDSPQKAPVKPIVQPLQSGLYFLHARYLWLLIAAIGLGLAMACLNVATLLLAHGRSREREAAMCAALGATPARIALMPLFQALFVCVAGSVVALAVCAWIQPIVLAVVPPSFRPFATPALDHRIIALALLTACAAAGIAAVVPVFALRRLDVLTIVRGRTSRVARWRGTGTLVAAEAAVAVVLATGAAVAVPGFIRLIGNPRFDPADLYEVFVGPLTSTLPSHDGYEPYASHNVRAVLDAIHTSPSVLRAAAVNVPLVGDIAASDAFWKTRGINGGEWGVSEDLLDVMRTPVVAGRGFTRDEVDQRALVAMINERAAHELWPGAPSGDVIGRPLQTTDGPRTIVGVFADITRKPGETPLPGLFVPITAAESPVLMSQMTVLVRTRPGGTVPLSELQARIRVIGGSFQLASRVESIAEGRVPFLQQPRFQAQLFGVLGGLGLVLAAIGLYAVTAVDVSKRQYELAVRLMLGSRPSQLHRLVLRRAGGPVFVGLALGALATWWASRLSKSVLGMDVFAPWAIAAVIVVLLGAFACACVFPARRASRVQPLVVLREL